MHYFLQGMTMGLAYVAPIGVQNLFVIDSALTHSRRRALVTALIVIFFDVTLAFACFFGIGAVVQRYVWLQMMVLLAGSLVVICMGAGLLRAKSERAEKSRIDRSIRKTISSACVVTWFNPQAIIDGTMMTGAFYVTLPASQSMPFIFGVAAASCMWFTGVTLVVSIFRSSFDEKVIRMINRFCGVVIIFYGIKLFGSFVAMAVGCFVSFTGPTRLC